VKTSDDTGAASSSTVVRNMMRTSLSDDETASPFNFQKRFVHEGMPDHTVGVVTLPGELPLVSGGSLSDVHVAFETWGSPDETASNAVLVCHALTGDSHVANGEDIPVPGSDGKSGGAAHGGEAAEGDGMIGSQGWWAGIVGPGKAIDTNRYFVICMNVLGSCAGTTGPLAPDPQLTDDPTCPADPQHRYALDFPFITIEDMVEVEFRALNELGVGHLLAVAGGSLGGMQALVWAREHPDRVSSCIAIATTWLTTPQNIAFDEVGRRSIVEDPDFKGGRYTDDRPPAHGLAVARMIGHITYLSAESMGYKFGRQLVRDHREYTFGKEFQVESYLEHQGTKFVDRFDADSYLYLTRAVDYYALGASLDEVTEEYQDTDVRFLLLSFDSDWLYPTEQMRELAGALSRARASVTFAEIRAPQGHDAFLLETEVQGAYVSYFLNARLGHDERCGVDGSTPFANKPTLPPESLLRMGGVR
jgi:homoserine O-acetyltransferase